MIEAHESGTGIPARQSIADAPEHPRVSQVRIHKELRELLPLSLFATAIAAIAHISNNPNGTTTIISSLAIPVFYLIVNLIGVSPFGTEFSNGTMARLLSQPISRAQIWREKILIGILAMAPAPLVILFLNVFLPRDRGIYFAWFVAGFCLDALFWGSTAAILLRQRFTAFFLSALIPIFIILIFNGILGLVFEQMDIVMAIFTIIAAYASWFAFKRLEV